MDQWLGWVFAGFSTGAGAGLLLRATRFNIVCDLLIGLPLGLIVGIAWFLGDTGAVLFLVTLTIALLGMVYPVLKELLTIEPAPTRATRPRTFGY